MIRAAEKKSGQGYTMDVVPMQRKGTPEEIAEAVAWFLSTQSSYVTSSFMNVDGGWLH
jgi:NAD(P)-dependent dehydrogenase (short-subunit alcohol dehydrogenase family)